MPLVIELATPDDASAIAAIRVRAADDLTERHGAGHWSSLATERSVLAGFKTSKPVVARAGGKVVGTLSLQTKKPWAIDTSYFARSKRPWYLTNMAVDPGRQRQGIGRALLDAARGLVAEWGGDAIRLDAYDHAAGAGEFYVQCGYTEVGRATYRIVPLIYYELLIAR